MWSFTWIVMTKKDLESRNTEIVRLREEGLTLEQIASKFGITRERARQIANQGGAASAAELRRRRQLSQAERGDHLRQAIISFVETNLGLDIEDVAERLGVTVTELRRLAPSHIRRLTVSPDDRSAGNVRWSPEDILTALRQAATYEYPLSAVAYAGLVSSGEVDGPSVPLVFMRYGSWTAACTKAGIESGVSPIENYESRWTERDLLRSVRTYLLQPDSLGTFEGYGSWARSLGDDTPSSATIRVRLGTWNSVKRRALQLQEGPSDE